MSRKKKTKASPGIAKNDSQRANSGVASGASKTPSSETTEAPSGVNTNVDSAKGILSDEFQIDSRPK